MKFPALALAATLAALTLTGCASQDDGDLVPASETATSASPEAEEGAEAVQYAAIPQRVRREFFPNAYTRDTEQWRPRVTVTDTGTQVQRRMPPCDEGKVTLDIDADVRGFADTVRTTADGYLIARHLTLYPDAATAATFASQMQQAPVECVSFDNGAAQVGGWDRSHFTADRFVGIKGKSTVFSEQHLHTAAPEAMTSVDIVTTRGNAVMLTRVSRRGNDGDVLGNKAKHPQFLAQVRAQGQIGVRVLDALD